MTLMIDSRAGSVELIPLLPPEITVKRKLEGGDVAFFGYGPDGPFTMPIGIEYKTANEAVSSMQSGRLVGEQLPKMTSLYGRVYLLIEGEYREGPSGILQFRSWNKGIPGWNSFTKTTYRQFDNFLNSLSEIGHVIVKRSLNRPESASQILDLYYLWTKDYEDHKSCFRFSKANIPPQLSKPSLRRLIAAQLPAIGWELSKRAESYFPTTVEMINAGEEEWIGIPGVGKAKAKKIYQSLREI